MLIRYLYVKYFDQYQFAFQQWFNLYAPSRVDEFGEDINNVNTSTKQDEVLNLLDANRVFKGKSETMKTQIKQGKKKQGSNTRTYTTSRYLGNSGFKSHR